jgi:hypothetical protein
MSKNLELDSKHVQEGLARFTFRLRESEKLLAFTECLIQPFQDIENALQNLYEVQSDVDMAQGRYLDDLGYLVGQAREGRTDEVYRLWIKARILVNKSTGTPDDFFKVLRILEATSVLEYTCYVAEFRFRAFGIVSTPDELFKIMTLMKGSGIRLIFDYSTVPLSEVFRFGGTVAAPLTSSVYGFGHGVFAGESST